MEQDFEIYPMPMFPTLAVGDVGASAGWYSEVVGFGTVFVLPGADGDPVVAHLRWRKYADVLLVPDGAESADRKGVGVSLSFLVGDMSVDAMAEKLVGLGVELDEGPVTRAWNTREIVVVDPDGYRLVFFEAVDVGRSFDDVMEAVTNGE
ncbi:MAG: VOC family protein [Chloroflexota bacterium]|nr:VOC family protein [Chloroflexota bacterium]MDE2918466.1 VOC family protein [Chloroflexota bacterium]